MVASESDTEMSVQFSITRDIPVWFNNFFYYLRPLTSFMHKCDWC